MADDGGLTSIPNARLFRNIVERSPMVNNDEHVLYTELPMSYDDVRPNKLVVSRPVYGFEIKAGLKVEDGDLFGRKEPEVTLVADAVWRIKTKFDGFARVGMFDGDMAKAVAHEIAYDYYDCMSGGCPVYVLSIMRYACKEFGVPGETRVYPGPDGWHTIADFMDDTVGAPDIREIMGKHIKSLPAIGL